MLLNVQRAVKKKPAVFPVERTVVIYGLAKKRVLNRGDVVKCWWCGNKIKLTRKNTFTVPGDPCDMTYVHGKECKMRTSVLYLFDRVVKQNG